jgi:ribonuclease D
MDEFIVVTTVTPALEAAFRGATVVALDIEGVDLGRNGVISVVQVATADACFILDVLGKDRSHPLVVWSGALLSDPNVCKVIHDCRMDADALFFAWGIALTNVHDTSVWHDAITRRENTNLNDMLEYNGLRSNVNRQKNVYSVNYRFWETRPLTASMKQWPAGDVQLLLKVQSKQMAHDGAISKQATAASTAFAMATRDLDTTYITVASGNIGSFIGHRGANIRAIQNRTGTLVYGYGAKSDHKFVVYYKTNDQLQKVQNAARTTSTQGW